MQLKMFSSPSIRVYNSENVDNLVQRKPGINLTMRKPFLDRSVNSKTPNTGKLLKPKLNFTKETVAVEKPKVSPKRDLNAEEFMYSYKEVEDADMDIWPKTGLNTRGLIKILRNYCAAEDTPPHTPEPVDIDISPIFFKLPEMEMPKVTEDLLNKTFDVEIPELDYDDLDRSF